MFDIGEHLGREFGLEEEFERYLAHAEYMHRNFYDNDRRDGSIRLALADAAKFVDELERIRAFSPRPYTFQDNDDRIWLGRLLGLQRSERPPIGDQSPVGYSRTHQIEFQD